MKIRVLLENAPMEPGFIGRPVQGAASRDHANLRTQPKTTECRGSVSSNPSASRMSHFTALPRRLLPGVGLSMIQFLSDQRLWLETETKSNSASDNK